MKGRIVHGINPKKHFIRKETKMKTWQILCLVLAILCLAYVGGVQAQEKYPTRPIELVVPFAPGGNADSIARIYSEELGRNLNVQINVVNRGGGAGVPGTTHVINAKKDGYTLLAAPGTPLTIQPIISKEVPYDPIKDLIPLGKIASIPSAFTVRNDAPFKTLKELVEFARKNPGKIKNAAAGIGAESQFNLEILSAHNKIKITTVPFKSGGEALPALLGGHVDMTSISLQTVGPHIKAGKLLCLAITSKTRHPDFPGIPTTTELGFSHANLVIWTGMFAATGVPESVQKVLIPAVEKTFKNPEVVALAKKAGFTVEYMGPEELRKFLESEIRAIKKVAEEANLIGK
jgi:tripartite-type tricarboxylate transporter receptor subunit TctC